jgi:plasmid maintenance system antidote protein VapI
MKNSIDEPAFSLLREIYYVLAAFADVPQNTISRIGGGKIHVADDLANHLARIIHGVRGNIGFSSLR